MKKWKVPMKSLSSSVIVVEAETEEFAIAAAELKIIEIDNRNPYLITSEICSNGQVTETK